MQPLTEFSPILLNTSAKGAGTEAMHADSANTVFCLGKMTEIASAWT